MNAAAPFKDDAALYLHANEIWARVSKADWLEAFAAHPEIGDKDALQKKYQSAQSAAAEETHTVWEANEQAGANSASEMTLNALAEANKKYKDRFHFIFLVCATGKTALQMLHILNARKGNDPAAELQIASGEQAKITKLRLAKMLSEMDDASKL